jgi:aminoglycoside phosphotransferase (APT) family kinase protein
VPWVPQLAEDLPTPAVADLIPPLIPGVVLAAVPGCESGRPPLAVQVLAGGGGHNDVRLVETSAGKFVVRRRLPPLVRAGSDASLELSCLRSAAIHGLAPQVVAAANDGSWMVMQFVPGTVWREQDLVSVPGVRRLGAQLAKVHALTVTSDMRPMADMRPMDAGAIAQQQLHAIMSQGMGRQGEAVELARRAGQLAQVIQARGAPTCINHGDLQHSNLIGPLPLLIDWEYAQIAGPTYDIACLLTYYPQLQPLKADLMAAAGLPRAEDLEVLGLQQQLFACLNDLWGIANGLPNGLEAG